MYFQGGSLVNGPYPSSTPQTWDPVVVLGLHNHEKSGITCPGTAKRSGQRCRITPARHKVNYALGILRGLASKTTTEAAGSPELCKAVNIMLCIYHGDQSEIVLHQWRSNLNNWVTKSSNKSAYSCTNTGAYSGIPRCEPYVKREPYVVFLNPIYPTDQDNAERWRMEEERRRNAEWLRMEQERIKKEEEELRRRREKARKEYEEWCRMDQERIKREQRKQQEEQRRKEEEERRRKEEEERKRKEEEEHKRREEERKQKEEEERRRKQEERRKEEEKRRREEEQKKKQEEEATRERAFRERVRLAREKREREAKEKAENEEREWRSSWNRYARAWNSGFGMDPEGIVWPVKSGRRSDVNEANVKLFFAKAPPNWLVDTGEKRFKFINTENKRWHTDKVMQRFGSDVVHGPGREALNTVAMVMIELRQEAQRNR